MTIDPLLLVAREHQADLLDQARRHALVRLVQCCRPSVVRRALGLLRDARPHPARPACC